MSSLPGYLSGEALHRLIGQAKALVLPSEWYENAPISVLEAYALETPVIGAKIGGIPEMILEGETGLMAMPGNVQDLAAALSRDECALAAGTARDGGARHANGLPPNFPPPPISGARRNSMPPSVYPFQNRNAWPHTQIDTVFRITTPNFS